MVQRFDQQRIIANRSRARRRWREGADYLMERCLEDLALRLSTITRTFDDVLLLHGRDERAAGIVREAGHGTVRLDQIDLPGVRAEPSAGTGDAETVPASDRRYDLIVSLLHLQDVEDVPAHLWQIARNLKSDGLFLAAFVGGSSLSQFKTALVEAEMELRGGAAMRMHPLIDVRDAGALLQRTGFALPVIDLETVAVRYSTVRSLVADLRAMGATNALADRSGPPLNRSIIERAEEIYRERFADADGRLPVTFDLIWLSGWAPHKSQQKPLRPGSAKASLAKALATPPGPESD